MYVCVHLCSFSTYIACYIYVASYACAGLYSTTSVAINNLNNDYFDLISCTIGDFSIKTI